MKKSHLLGVMCVGVLYLSQSFVSAATTVYTDKIAWENALGEQFLTEDFSDDQLNTGVSFVSNESGHINPGQQNYQDTLSSTSQNEPMTTWSFTPQITGYGGDWTLGGPGGSGNSLQVYIDGVYVDAISNSYGGEFWGLISDSPFTSVKLIGGSGTNQQHYSLDNMVYSPVPPALVSAALPTSRSVQLGNAATAFATIINTGTVAAVGCDITPLTSVLADFSYQTTDPDTNTLTGIPNMPVDIAAGTLQTYLFAFTPTAEIAPTDVQLSYDCTNTEPAPVTSGLNTLLLSASSTPVPDIVALAATPTSDGAVSLPGVFRSNAFSVAAVNVGSTDTITASAAPSVALPLVLVICETNPGTGVCLSAAGSSATSTVNAGATLTYSVFVAGTGTVPFDPATNRINVEFRDGGNVVRGSTSVAVRTQ